MKNIRKQRRYTLGFGIFALAAILTFQASANPFNDGTTNNISTDTVYNSTLYVGVQNPDNSLIITNDATVLATDLIVGQLQNSTNNLVSVIGDSRLVVGDATTNGLTTGGIVVGDNDGDAALILQNDSTIDTDNLYVGFGTNDSGKIKVSGNGSEINVANDAFVGYDGSTNSIDIGTDASLNIGGNLNIGYNGGSNNEVNVSGNLFVNSTNNINVVNPDADNGITIKANGTLQVGGAVDTGTLDDLGVDLAANASLEVGGALQLEDNKINGSHTVILNDELSTNNTAIWNSSTLAVIGDTTSNNSLIFTNGATGTSANILQVGSGTSARNNALIVGGTGSRLVALSDVMIGAQGDNNEFVIDGGGEATVAGNLYLGNNSGATGNEVRVGSNSVLNALSDVIVGDNGSDNTFTLNQGTVTVGNDFVLGSASGNNRYFQTGGSNTVSGEFIIGKTAGATGQTGHVDDDAVETTGNLAIIGDDATLNLQSLTVGLEGGGCIMTIRDGGLVNVDGDVVIGEAVGDNYIYLQRDSNTQFNVTGDLVVGKEGGSNRFAAYGGTANIDGNLYLGASTNQHEIKNFIHVETTNAVINVANAIHIGASNSLNTLDIVAGATVNAQDLYVGGIDGVSNNVVTVTGENSLLSISNSATVGAGGNSITVENGGWLAVGESTTTNLPPSTGGAIAVGNSDGSASFTVGESSSAEAGYIYIGAGTNDTGSIAISGSNTTLSATQDLVVGVYGSSNTLSIADGATASGNLIIGQNAGANSNSVTIAGTDSSVDANEITIGAEMNSGNTLNLNDGALLTLNGSLNIASNNALNINDGGTFKSTGDFNLTHQSTNGFNFNSGATLEVGGMLTATNALDGGRNIVLDGGQWNVETNLLVGINTDSNNVSVTGSGALLTANGLDIGSTNTVGNTLLIEDGGTVEIEEHLSIANGNVLNLGSNGTLQVVGDFTALSPSATNFNFGEDAILKVGGMLTTSTNQNTISKGQTIVIDGSLSTNHTAQWNVGNDLYIGSTNGSGTLSILDGALLESISAEIGNANSNRVSITGAGSLWTISSNLTVGASGSYNELLISGGATNDINFDAFIGQGDSSNNTVIVSGNNSLWNIGNNLTIGGMAENGNNWLQVLEGANVSVANDMTLKNGSVLDIGTNSTVSVMGDYNQDRTSELNIYAGQETAGLLDVEGDANFTNGTSVKVKSHGDLVADENFRYTIIDAGTLTFGSGTNGTDGILKFIGALDGATNYLVDSSLVIEGTAASLADIIGADPDSQLGRVADEIDGLSTPEAIEMYSILSQMEVAHANEAMDNYYGEKSSSTPANNMINLGLQSVAQQITMRADNTRSRMGVASSKVNWNKPSGVAGPHESGQELQGWISAYATRADQSGSGGFSSYDANVNGFMIGADLSVAENVLVGVAGGSGNTSIDKDNDADADTKTTFVAVYASTGTRDWFTDTSIIFGNSSIDSTLGSTFDTTADYDAKNVAIYFGGGKEITGEYLIFTPQASLLGNYYKQDAYTEDATTAVARDVDSFDAFYLQSSLGASLGFYTAMGNVTLKPEIRLHWLHEWNASDESLDYSLVGGANNYSMKLQAPEEDIIKLGVGTSAKLGDYLELRADLDTRQGSDYSDYTILGSLRYQF